MNTTPHTCQSLFRTEQRAGSTTNAFTGTECGAPATHRRTLTNMHGDTTTVRYCTPCAPANAEPITPAPAGQSAPDAAGVTYAPRGAALKTTGHYRRPGTTQLYCGRPAGTRNGIFRDVNGWKLCTRCVKAEERDRNEAAAVAEQHREDTTADQPAAASTWRSDWIGATPDDGLFTLTPDREQGALFA